MESRFRKLITCYVASWVTIMKIHWTRKLLQADNQKRQNKIPISRICLLAQAGQGQVEFKKETFFGPGGRTPNMFYVRCGQIIYHPWTLLPACIVVREGRRVVYCLIRHLVLRSGYKRQGRRTGKRRLDIFPRLRPCSFYNAQEKLKESPSTSTWPRLIYRRTDCPGKVMVLGRGATLIRADLLAGGLVNLLSAGPLRSVLQSQVQGQGLVRAYHLVERLLQMGGAEGLGQASEGCRQQQAAEVLRGYGIEETQKRRLEQNLRV